MAQILSVKSVESVGVPLFYSGLDLSAGNFAYLVASCYTPTPYAAAPVIYGSGWTMVEANALYTEDGPYGRLVILTKANPTANETVGLCYGHAITGHIILCNNVADAGVAGLGGGVVIIGGGDSGLAMNGAGDTDGAVTNGTGTNPGGGLVELAHASNPIGLIAMMTKAANKPTAAPSGWTNFKVQTSYHPDAPVIAIATAAVAGTELDGTAATFTAASGDWASATLVMSG
jgi:hypothetical protein